MSAAHAKSETLRALLVGAGIGVILAAGNVYAGLKTGYIDGGAITAALVGSLLLGLWARRPAGAHELNLTQTVASSAAVMSFAAGIAAPIPALGLVGHRLPSGVTFLWGLSLGVLGIALAAALRARLVVEERLPFPSGQVTASVIEAVAAPDARARGRRALITLAAAALIAGLVTYLRDGRSWLPAGWSPSLTIAGVAAAALGLGLSSSPLLAATGVLVGVRGALSMALGAVIAWVGIAPPLVRQGIASEASYPALVPLLLWPGVGLMVASALVSLAFDWPTLRRALVDLRGLLAGLGRARREPGAGRLLGVLALLAVVPVLAIAAAFFRLSPALVLPLLPVALLLAAAAARAAGETDQAPVGQVGSLAQIGLGTQGVVGSLGAGALVGGIATQTAQTLWAFKAGHRLGASPRAQLAAQLLGAVVGAAVVVPTYQLVIAAHALGSSEMPAPAALAWRATAEAAQGRVPAAIWPITVVAALAGAVLTALERKGVRRLPSPTALGTAFVLPAAMSLTILAGALAFALAARRAPAWTVAHGPALAAGGIAGESLVGLLLAALAVAGGG